MVILCAVVHRECGLLPGDGDGSGNSSPLDRNRAVIVGTSRSQFGDLLCGRCRSNSSSPRPIARISLQLSNAVAEVRGQVCLCGLIEAVQEARHLDGTVSESSTEPVGVRGLWLGAQLVLVSERVQVTDGQFENIGLFQFGYVFTLLYKKETKDRYTLVAFLHRQRRVREEFRARSSKSY